MGWPKRFSVTLVAIIAALPAVATADARVVVVAAGDSRPALIDAQSNRVTGRVRMPGRVRAVAMAPDGARAFLGAGRQIVALDLGSGSRAGAVALGGVALALAVTPDGTRVLAARANGLEVV